MFLDLRRRSSTTSPRTRRTSNVVFYLATAPQFFGPVVEGLGKAGLTKEGEDQFRRIIIEKPFGTDLKSARALDEQILKHRRRETRSSASTISSARRRCRTSWCCGSPTSCSSRSGTATTSTSIQITAAETVGVETRGKFYDKTGALRDMLPNHMFQLLAMMTMEAPNSFDADAVRAEKAKVIEAIRRMTPEEAVKNSVRGQYVFGEVKGKPMQAYRQSPDVDPKSRTETYRRVESSSSTTGAGPTCRSTSAPARA